MIKISGNYVIDADDKEYTFGELKARNVTKDGHTDVKMQLVPLAFTGSVKEAIRFAIGYFQKQEIAAHDYSLLEAVAKLDEISARLEKSLGTIREE